MLVRRIEEASLNAWPARHQLLVDGWILRFSEGYTKRANSITPLYPSNLDVEQKIRLCEQLYSAQGLPPIFRVTPMEDSVELDRSLHRLNYAIRDQTLVMGLELTDLSEGESHTLKEFSLERWLNCYYSFRDDSAENQSKHEAILKRIVIPHLQAVICLEQKPVSCGLGVLDGEFFGLFDLVTSPTQRGKGFGTRLIQDMLTWGYNRGARFVFLQVAENNIPARCLYQRLGFQEVYSYWYRLPS